MHQKSGTGKPSLEKYLGHLFTTESYKIFGYATVTNVKFILGFSDLSQNKDKDIKDVCNLIINLIIHNILI